MQRMRSIAVALGTVLLIAAVTISAANAPQQTSQPVKAETILRDPQFGTAEYILGRFKTSASNNLEAAAHEFIGSRPDAFSMAAPAQELELIKSQTDDLGKTHLRFQQKYQGLNVWARQTIVHFDSDNTIYMVGGQTIPTPQISTSAAIDQTQAERFSLEALKDQSLPTDVTQVTELIVYPYEGEAHLAQLVTITSPTNGGIRWRVFVDAQTGQVLHKFNDIHFDGPDTGSGPDTRDTNRVFPIYLQGSDYKLWNTDNAATIYTYQDFYGGGPISTDPDGDKIWDDNLGQKAEVAGHYYTDLTVKYFWNTFGRNSYDDLGSSVLVNVHDPVYVNNAYWNGQGINFADGDGVNYLPFSGSKDVVAHEFTHGVTEYTAGLIYQFQSGAINESMSDVFGANVDRDDWQLGEEISLTGGFIRDMSNPGAKGHPGSMDQYINYPIEVDNGGVHRNSGIGNYCYYWAASLMGHDDAEQIWYRALTVYLTPNSGYYFLAGALKRAAADIFGEPSTQVDDLIVALEFAGLNTAYASVENVDYGVAIGQTGQVPIWIYNPGPYTLDITAVAPTVPGVSLAGGAGYQLSVPAGDSSEFYVGFDATSLGICDIGLTQDSIRIDVSGNIETQIKIPLDFTVGYTSTAYATESISPACVDIGFDNRNSIFNFFRDGQDAIFSASPIIAMVNDGDTSVYTSFFGDDGYATVDPITTGADSSTFRFASRDGRIQGYTRIEFDPALIDSCGFATVEYVFYSPCDTPLTVKAGFVGDFDISGGSANRVNLNSGLNMVYTMDDPDSRAAGVMLISGTAYNLRALPNASTVWNGQFDNAQVMLQMSQGTNQTGAALADYSQLLTYGDVAISQTDSVRIKFALLYSNTGSGGLSAIAEKALEFGGTIGCCLGIRGNVNADPEDKVNISDVTFMTAYLFGIPAGPAPACTEEGNANADPEEKVNISDVTFLTSYLFGIPAGPAPPDCP